MPQKALSGSLGVLEGFARAGDSRARRAVGAALTLGAAGQLGREWFKKTRARFEHTVTLPEQDDVYEAVHAWLLRSLPSSKRRALKVRTWRMPEYLSADSRAPKHPADLKVFYDGSRTHVVDIGGHAVRVDVVSDAKTSIQSFEDLKTLNTERIVFTCRSEAGRDAVLEFLRELAISEYGSAKSRLYLAQWSDWVRRDIAPRSLDTVVLRAGHREALMDDFTRFLADEDTYTRLGLPWHRGYLFHGPPGTGKTSLAKALAGHFGMDLYFVPLSDIKADISLLRLLSAIPQRSVLVLEDIDVAHGAKSRDDSESNSVSLSGLLNALDGLATPPGLVTIMTTNDIDALDPALIRAGRADWIEELGGLDQEQFERLATIALDGPLTRPVELADRPGAPVTHADVLEVLKRHIGDPDAATAALEKEFAS